MRTRTEYALVAVASVCAAIAYFSIDIYRGKAAVAQMCRLNGGLHVSETVYAPGYLDESSQTGEPIVVIDNLAAHGFEYVDIQKHNKYEGSGLFDSMRNPGYYRISLAAIGDPHCIFQSGTKVGYLADAAKYGMPAGRCLAIQRLEQRPIGYLLRVSSKSVVAENGKSIGVNEYMVTDDATGRQLGVSRDYVFVGKISSYLDMSGGGGTIDASCRVTEGIGVDVDVAGATLRDEGKKANGNNGAIK